MKAAITGAGGFIGGRLAAELIASGSIERLVLVDSKLAAPPKDTRVTAIEGDITDANVRARAVEGIDVLFHLAAVPGGASEANYALSRAVNVDAALSLFEQAAKAGCKRAVYTSSIAVLGDPLPARVTDDTPCRPTLIYGAHKLMMEIALADFARRGALNAVAVRLPGIVARPAGPSGLKSAFMSDVFHALKAGRPFVSPVSAQAQMWLMSATQCARNLIHAAGVLADKLPRSRTVTLPALRASMAELVGTIAAATGADTGLVSYEPDAKLEAAFGAYPPLETRAADHAGFTHDASLAALVKSALGAR